METENIDYSQYQNLGRLHRVKRSLKEYICRDCQKRILIGEEHFRQHQTPIGAFFPIDTKVCSDCGNFMNIKIGIQIAEKKVKL